MQRGIHQVCLQSLRGKGSISSVRNNLWNGNILSNRMLLSSSSSSCRSSGSSKYGGSLNGAIFCESKRYITRYWAEYTKKKIHDSKINEWREQFAILDEYNDKDLMIWRDSFNKMDKDKDNFISHADLQKSDWSLEKYTLFQNYDMDKNNLIDFGEYIQAVIDIDTQYFKNFFQGFSKIDIELEFQKYAITEKENNKKVIPLTKLMQMLKDKEFTCVTETDSLKLFNAMDLNNDGSIDFEDFLGGKDILFNVHDNS
ncbi:EF-hand calcium-binding domain-containing protein [Plasmodium brasilianum]|uniref:EF-hand calcium-binding domain-containing protein n=1 Tax=Plasmodium brasilianum TaxID=5824 RepID=A0ACB9YEC6_PLABR|nr:EF-hand calcium-binding domain-containing protein [Plasmodium brasilianum]